MGKDYDDYIGNTPTELSSLEIWGLSEEANAPWTMISDYDEKYNIKSPGHAIGKFGLVGAGVEGAYSTAQDIRKCSGQDRMWAMSIDGVGGVTGILIGGLLVPTGPVGAGISLGVNYGTNIGTSWLKEYYLETDTEKKHKRAMYEFLNGGYREKY